MDLIQRGRLSNETVEAEKLAKQKWFAKVSYMVSLIDTYIPPLEKLSFNYLPENNNIYHSKDLEELIKLSTEKMIDKTKLIEMNQENINYEK